MRVASLIPSATEIVATLGLGRTLVARSHSCDYPSWVRSLPALTSPKLDVEASSREIDAQVRHLVRNGLSVYRVDEEQLRNLAPDLILTQDQCEVCAASLADVEAAVSCWVGQDPRLVSLCPASLGDVLEDVTRVARAIGAPAQGVSVKAGLEREIEQIAARARRARSRPRIACLEWLEPLMFAGNWVPELVELAGAEPVFGDPGVHSSYLDWEMLLRADPDAVVLMPCGFDQDRTRAERAALEKRDEWWQLRAVRNGQVFVTDGHQYFNRPGPRLVTSLQILAEIAHPDEFPPTLRGGTWDSLYSSEQDMYRRKIRDRETSDARRLE